MQRPSIRLTAEGRAQMARTNQEHTWMIDRPRPIAMATLADLDERVALHARCARCGRVRRLDLAGLRARYGALPLERLRKRLRCGRCGARHPELTRLWDVGGP